MNRYLANVLKALNLDLLMKTKLILTVYLLIFCALSSEKLDFKISMLGVKAADISFVDSLNTLNIAAKSNSLTSLFYDFDYEFKIIYKNNYLPISYKKKVNQEDYSENRVITYNRVSMQARRISFLAESKNKTYTINKSTRDFYSAMYYLRQVANKDTILWLDAASRNLKAKVSYLGKEKISIGLGKFKADKFVLNFEVVSDLEKERSDMLTNNLQKTKNKMYFWFSTCKKRLPLKAKYAQKPFAAYWELLKYE